MCKEDLVAVGTVRVMCVLIHVESPVSEPAKTTPH